MHHATSIVASKNKSECPHGCVGRRLSVFHIAFSLLWQNKATQQASPGGRRGGPDAPPGRAARLGLLWNGAWGKGRGFPPPRRGAKGASRRQNPARANSSGAALLRRQACTLSGVFRCLAESPLFRKTKAPRRFPGARGAFQGEPGAGRYVTIGKGGYQERKDCKNQRRQTNAFSHSLKAEGWRQIEATPGPGNGGKVGPKGASPPPEG